AKLLVLRATVLRDVAQAYYNVLRAEQSVEVLRNSLAVQEERVRDIRGRQRAGVARPLDVSLIESQAAETRTTLIRALRDVENARSILSFLIDADARDGALTDKFDLPVDAPSLEQFFQLALAQRQDLLAAIANIDAARRAVDEAVGQYYPSVSLDVDYFLSRQSTPTESDWSALLRANLPIFSAGRIQADVRTAWSRLHQAALAENLTRRQVIQDVEVAYQNVASSGETLAELQVQLAAQQEALRQAEASYNAGLGTNLERLVAQDALLTTQLELANEQYDQKVFYLNLQRAAGRLGTDPATPLVVAPTTRVSDDAHVHR
ncbi:MAG: TolC family protein, partial [Tepidisphaeraceae bacterium]